MTKNDPLITVARTVIEFQDGRPPKYKAPETETCRPILPRDWPSYGDMRALIDLYEAMKMARDTFARLRAHPKWPWKDQDGEGIPIEVFLDEALRKAGGEP